MEATPHAMAERITTLEDLLRRNEGSLTAVLQRLKESELALTSMHQALGRVGPDLASTIEEVRAQKRRMDNIDQATQQQIREVASGLSQEIQANKPQPLATDPVFQRLAQDSASSRADLQETVAQVRRLNDTTAADGMAIKAIQEDTKWLAEQIRTQAAAHRDTTAQQARKNEQLSQETVNVQGEVNSLSQSLRTLLDTAVKTVRDELHQKIGQEGQARQVLQTDLAAAFGRLRDDVMQGFTNAAVSIKNLDETANSLEAVVRAEVRTRMSEHETQDRRIDTVEDRLRREALSAAEYLKTLDAQMAAAVGDVREATKAELSGQLETLRRTMERTQEDVRLVSDKQNQAVVQADPGAKERQLLEQRLRNAITQETGDVKQSVLQRVDEKLDRMREQQRQQHQELRQHQQDAAATSDEALRRAAEHKQQQPERPKPDKQEAESEDPFARRGEVAELQTRLTVRLQEIERRLVYTEGTAKRATAAVGEGDAGDPTSPTSPAGMRMRQMQERVDDSEKQLLVVAEAVRDVHDELIEKLERLEAQSSAMDALQRSIQQTFDQDQSAIAEQTQALRDQLDFVVGELDAVKRPSSQPGKDSGENGDAAPDTEGGKRAGTPKTEAATTTSGGTFTTKQLTADLAKLQAAHTSLSHETRRDAGELRTQVEQLFERSNASSKALREDTTAWKAALAESNQRWGDTNEALAKKVHRGALTTDTNIKRLAEQVEAVSGKPVAVEPCASTNDAPTQEPPNQPQSEEVPPKSDPGSSRGPSSTPPDVSPTPDEDA